MSKVLAPLAFTNGKAKIDNANLKQAALVLRALNHKLRQQILKFIDDKKKTIVTDVYGKLKIEQSVASQHLAIMRNAGLVKATREGKFIFYTINYDKVKHVSDIVNDLVK
jgi:ArsR family transcriptional regulator, virulence genes transcriptional regulator